MKKIIGIAMVLLLLASTFSFASGGQNMNCERGDNGQGTVTRNQNSGNGK